MAATRWKVIVTVLVAGACLWALSHQLAAVTWDSIWAALQRITPTQMVVALAATFCSFWAMGAYDVLWHRHFGTGVSPARARVTGMATLAVSQSVGMGAVTGTLCRWHLLEPLSFRKASLITFAVCGSFLTGWALLAMLSAFWLGFLPKVLLPIALGLAGVAMLFALRSGRMRPYLQHAPRICLLTLIDLLCASVALWALLPSSEVAVFPVFFAGFVLAIGAGLISNAPGGVGAFEVVLTSVLITTPAPDLVAALIAFRVAYYGVPALCGGLILLAAQMQRPRLDPADCEAPNSDLCWQGAVLIRSGDRQCVARRHLLGTVALEPTHWKFNSSRYRIDFTSLYKCDAATAARARRHGWTVRRIASDAIITPQSWTSSGAKRSQLRRKLRQADKAGVTVEHMAGSEVTEDMARIAAQWKAARGGELGYTMGRYAADYVMRQRTYLINHGKALCGFVTVQVRNSAWSIDLIRHLPDMPQGAMHAAIVKIIDDAALAGVQTLSLGAVPDGIDCTLQRFINGQKEGLRQFKASFDPTWHPRYHAASSRAQFAASLLLITLRIQRPWSKAKTFLAAYARKFITIRNNIHLIHIK